MASFDVVSKPDWAEIDNALNQASREVAQRFDFKGTNATLEKTEAGLLLTASTEERVRAALDVLQGKLIKRKVSLKFLDVGEAEPGPKGSAKLLVKVKQGVDRDNARKLVTLVKESKIKVQASIQEDAVRISGKKRDDLQEVIALLRKTEIDLDLQFVNFRD